MIAPVCTHTRTHAGVRTRAYVQTYPHTGVYEYVQAHVAHTHSCTSARPHTCNNTKRYDRQRLSLHACLHGSKGGNAHAEVCAHPQRRRACSAVARKEVCVRLHTHTNPHMHSDTSHVPCSHTSRNEIAHMGIRVHARTHAHGHAHPPAHAHVRQHAHLLACLHPPASVPDSMPGRPGVLPDKRS